MKGIKKSIGIALSVVLLLSFSVTILPLDFLHNHHPEKDICKRLGTTTCQHKVHVSNKAEFCWVCAVHFDKTFTTAPLLDKIELSPALSLFTDNEVTGYFLKLLFSALRGPPTE